LKNRYSPIVNVSNLRYFLISITIASGLLAQAEAQQTASPGVPASTAESANGEIAEIIVSAQRRRENLQDVPITVEAFSEAQLAATGVASTADLPMVTPGLVFGQQIGYAQPFLRGVGSVAFSPGLENPVATYVDDVYYGPLLGSIMSLSNVAQVEVDKGPQGTLFGRNATGGLIQVRTKDPTQDFNGSVAVTYGNYKTIGTDIYLTGGVTRDLAADLAVHVQDQGQGYGRNLVTGMDINRTQEVDLRNKWLFRPSDETEIKLILDFERNKNSDAYATAPGTTPVGAPMFTGNPQNIAAYYQPYGTLDEWGASVHVRQGIADVGQLISITAFRHEQENLQGVATLAIDPELALSSITTEVHHQFSQEFQFVSPESSKIKWATGAYFFDSLSAWRPENLTGGYIFPYESIANTSDQRAVSGALYGQATLEVLPATDLTVGARYTYERHSIVLGVVGATYPGYEEYAYEMHDIPNPISFKKPTWRLALDHRFTPDLMAYISYNRGFKSGGFNDIQVPANEFLPETLDAYEVGTKADFFGNRLQLNTSAFLYNYKNMQNALYYNNSEFIYNSAAAKLYGLDVDGKVGVTKNFAITASAEWLHTYYTSFSNANFSTPVPGGGTVFAMNPPLGAKGHHVPLAPDATFSIGADYTVETSFGDIVFNATDSYNSGWFAEPDNRLHQNSYNIVNARMSWNSTDKTDTVSFWGKNLTNVNYLTALASATNGDYSVFAPPRTYGVTVSKKF
jgi:iron complex outermembrane receptor protein